AVPVAFVPDPGDPGVYVASLVLPEPGEWSLRADVGGTTVDAAVRVVAPDPADRTRPDPVRRERFVAAVEQRGGTLLDTGDAASLSRAFPPVEPSRATSTWRPAQNAAWA